MKKFSDKEILFEALKANNRKAQRVFYEEVFPKLCKSSFKLVKNREAARDIAIDRFQKCLARVQEMDNYQQLVGVLFTANKNLSLNYLRDEGDWDKYRTDPIDLDVVPDNATMNDIIECEIEAKMIKAAIRKHMANDNEINKKVAELAFIELWTNQEIADELGISVKSVKNRKCRMLPGLRDALRKCGFYLFF